MWACSIGEDFEVSRSEIGAVSADNDRRRCGEKISRSWRNAGDRGMYMAAENGLPRPIVG
jgi:hypothetical protein